METAKQNYCTLLAANYLPRGLALIESLARFSADFHIWVLCMDDLSYQLLTELREPSVTPVAFEQIMTDTLHIAIADRTLAETCWTCTPIICEYVLAAYPHLPHIIYVDSDVMFFDDPQRLFTELGDQSILIFEHGFPPRTQYMAEEVGRFNVEVIVFRNDAQGSACLAWWRDRCLEWCYHRREPSRMADQKYLDLWPELFDGVVIAPAGLVGLAPWNFESYQFSCDSHAHLLANGQGVLFVHFSKLEMQWQGRYQLCKGYAIPPLVKQLVYTPYIELLDHQWDRLLLADQTFTHLFVRPTFRLALRELVAQARRFAAVRLKQYLRKAAGSNA